MRTITKDDADDAEELRKRAADRIIEKCEGLEDALDAAAEQRARETGQPFLKCYREVLESEFGRTAFEKICDMRDAAARAASGRS